MKAKSWYLALVLSLILALMVIPLAGCESKPETDDGHSTEETEETVEEEVKDPYLIGAVLSLSGTYAGLGEPEKNTIELEVARINKAGGVNGHLIEVIYEDDATDSDTAVAATTRLIDKDGVIAIIGATGTGATMAMRQEIDRAGIPQVSVAGGTVITSNFDPLVFQTPWSNSLVVPFTLDYIEKQGLTKIAVMADSGGFGADGVDVITEMVADTGLEVVAEETFNPGDTDMTAQLTKVKAAGAEAVVMWSAGKEAAIVAANMNDLEMDIPLFGSHGNARTEFIEGAGDGAEGFRFAAGNILIPENYGADTEAYAVATDFVDRYTAAYDKAPDTFAGHAYDALYITVNAMETLDEGFTAEDLRSAIEGTSDFVGIGGTFTYSADDHNGMTTDDLSMYEVKAGVWVLAE